MPVDDAVPPSVFTSTSKASSAAPMKPREAFISGSRPTSPVRPAGAIAGDSRPSSASRAISGGEAGQGPPGSDVEATDREEPTPLRKRLQDTAVALFSIAVVLAAAAAALATTLGTAAGTGVLLALQGFAGFAVCFFTVAFAAKESAGRRAVWVGAAILFAALGAATGATESGYLDVAWSVAWGAFFFVLWRICGWRDAAPAAMAMKLASLFTLLVAQGQFDLLS